MRTQTRYKLKMLLLGVACVLFAGGCQRDDTAPESQGPDVNLGLDLGTYALGDDDSNALSHEKQIRSLHVFIYNAKGLLENPGNTQVAPAPGGGVVDAAGRVNGTWKVYEGEKTIYVVANAPTQLKTTSGGAVAANILNGPTLSQLKELCSDPVNYVSDYCNNQGADWTGGLMSGEVTASVTKTQSAVTVPLERRYARIDLAVRKSAELDAATVKVTKVKWSNFSYDVSVLPLVPEWLSKTPGGAHEATGLSYSLTADYVRIRPTGGGKSYEIYVMPKAVEQNSTPGVLELTVDVNGKEELYMVYLAQTAANGVQDINRPLNIRANRIYKVNTTLLRRSSDIEIKVLDWEDQDIQGDINGSMLSVSQSKVLMDWANFGEKFTTNVGYASDGLVSFVGYVTKDSAGKERVTTDGANLPEWLPAANIGNLPDGTTTTGTIDLEYKITSNAAHPDVWLRLKAGNITKDIQLIYDNGFFPESMLPVEWTLNRPAVGFQLTKRGSLLPSDAAAKEDIKAEWGLRGQLFRTGRGYGYGPFNTSMLIARSGQTNIGSYKCRQLGPDWYIMSDQELQWLAINQNHVGPSYYFKAINAGDSYHGQSSSEDPTTAFFSHNFVSVFKPYFSTGIEIRDNSQSFRCVRNVEPIKLSADFLLADYANWSNSFSKSIDFETTDGGSVSVEAIDNAGATKNWLTQAVVSGGDKGKITVTYTPTKSATHDDVLITLKTSKGGKRALLVRYDNGFIPSSFLDRDWMLERPGLGIQVAKMGNILPTGFADVNWQNERMQLAAVAEIPDAEKTGYGYGYSNTSAFIATLGANATAPNKCRSLGPEWYLSSARELSDIRSLASSLLGDSYKLSTNTYNDYWSSSMNAYRYAYCVNPGGGTPVVDMSYNNYVRCVRNLDVIKFSSSVLVADYANWDNSFSTTVNFESLDGGTVSVESIDNTGATKNWLTSAVVSGGTRGKVTVTYTPTNNDTHETVSITLRTSKGGTQVLSVKYDNGFIPQDMLPAAWTINRPGLGLQFAKKGNRLPSAVADRNWGKENRQWGNSETFIPSAQETGFGYGLPNTGALISVLGINSPAAAECRTLGMDWYFSSRDELEYIYSYQNILGESYQLNPGKIYWSSTDYDAKNSWYVDFKDGTYSNMSKYYGNYVRCVRNTDNIKLSTGVLVADYVNWGNSFSKSVNFESTDGGTVSVESIDNTGATKNWLTKVVVSGTTKGTVTVTYTPTNNITHQDVEIVLKTSHGRRQSLLVKYDNGLIPAAALPAAWTQNRPANGLQFAKKGNVLPNATADANWDRESMTWSVGTSVPQAQQVGLGFGIPNTDAFMSLFANKVAAYVCRSMGGVWYVASREEMRAVQTVYKMLGPSYALWVDETVAKNAYWTSSEESRDYNWDMNFATGNMVNYRKTLPSRLRCVRNL